MNRAQEQFGEPLDAIRDKVKSSLDAVTREFISAAPFLVMATSDADGNCDASPKGGAPGFVKVLDEKTLLLPDIAGNKLFQSYENLETNAKVGMVFIIPGCGLTIRLNGHASVVGQDELAELIAAPEVHAPDKHTNLLQALRITVDEVYPHCTRAFKFADLWNTESIAHNAAEQSERYWYQRWAQALKADKATAAD
jgi:PPOX class probable FMN-dependent enzyme